MSAPFEIPNYEVLLAEQAEVQARKFNARQLQEYDDNIFLCQSWRKPRGSAVVDFVRPLIGKDDLATLRGVLQGLVQRTPELLVRWVDMGGGRALPMRELACDTSIGPNLQMTNVDLFDWGLDGLNPQELSYLEKLAPGMTQPEAAPTLLMNTVEMATLPEKADIITSVQLQQYVYDPLGALANCYNQLADDGIMLVAGEHAWSEWIRYATEPGYKDYEETPTKHLLEEFSRNNVNYAATEKADELSGLRYPLEPQRFSVLAVEKQPNTQLRVTRPITEVRVPSNDFKAVYYEAPTDSSPPIVELFHTDPHSALGAISLSDR